MPKNESKTAELKATAQMLKANYEVLLDVARQNKLLNDEEIKHTYMPVEHDLDEAHSRSPTPPNTNQNHEIDKKLDDIEEQIKQLKISLTK